jgi:hypothetical protein
LEHCRLQELGFRGPKFTWTNGRQGADPTLERLDRALANKEWCELFDVVEVSILARICSDHNPVHAVYSTSSTIKWNKRRQFRFEADWLVQREPRKIIRQEWRAKPPSSNKWCDVRKRLSGCRMTLQQWVRKQVNSVEDLVKAKSIDLLALQSSEGNTRNEEETNLKADLNSLLEQEELKWRQRAKENWLKHGDRNTKYFHACASQRSKKNAISEVLDKDGQSCVTQVDIESAFVDYFQDLLIAGDSLKMEACTNPVERRVNAQMNQKLLAYFTRLEIFDALQQMAPMKAPGLDGFPACFFQQS